MARGEDTPRRAQQRQLRPASANAIHLLNDDLMAGPSSNYGRSALGSNAAANSSSTSLNIASRPSMDSHYARMGSSSAAFSGSPGQRPEPTADAPFLATAESHLGRRTLVAPDNVRRRKAEEREKKKGAARKKRNALEGNAETSQAAIAAAVALVGLPTTTTTTTAPAARPAPASAPRRPQLGTSRSTSNLATLHHQEQQSQPRQSQDRDRLNPRRAASPIPQTRRARSAQGNHRAESSPERAESSVAADTRPPAPQTSARHARREGEQTQGQRRRHPRREGQSRPAANRQRSNVQETQQRDAVRAEVLRRATRRRRDIYADLPALGLPGVSDDDEEEIPPPPFPGSATRPLTPPPFPSDDAQWTEELRRRHEEYNANRPPESPPPAFVSDVEGSDSRNRRASEDEASSADEGSQAHHSEAQKLWDADTAAGYSVAERVERARRRSEGLPLDGAEGDPDSNVQPIANVSLGQLVTEARARRGLRSEPNLSEIANEEPEQADSASTAATPAPEQQNQQRQQAASNAVTTTSQAHRRTISEEVPKVEQSRSAVPERAHRRVNNAAIGTGRGLISQPDREIEPERRPAKATRLRPRPAGAIGKEGHSRFRDDASAAAYRRQALWGNALPEAIEPRVATLPDRILPVSSVTNERGPLPRVTSSERPVLESLPQPRRSSAGAVTQHRDEVDSSDSEDAWAREDDEFQRLQGSRDEHVRQHDVETSEDEEEPIDRRVPGALPSRREAAPTAIELGRVGTSVPKAPPPLVLGRSRGGAAYSSSSEESSDSDIGRLREYEDESDSESPEETDDIDSAAGQSLPAHSQESLVRSSLDKGKKRAQTPFANGNKGSAVSMSSTHASSDDDVPTESEDEHATSAAKTHVPTTSHREVSSRLKDLFASPLAGASQDNFDTSSVHQRRRSSASTQHKPSVLEDSARSETATGTNAAHTATAESRARQEALEQLSQVKRSVEPLPPGVDRDSLAALERLLMRSGVGVESASSQSQSGEAGPASRLSRSNAINGRTSFVNPQSSIAPRPLGRLPTITDATRHFPAERNAGREPSPSISSGTSGNAAAMPGWMAKIPAAEREGLQAPLEPTRRQPGRASVGQDEGGAPRPPPLPARPSGRVNAMIAAFENQSRAADRHVPPSPAARAASVHRSLLPSSSSSREQSFDDSERSTEPRIAQLRRRPPPPPPASARQTANELSATQTGQSPLSPSHSSHQARDGRALSGPPIPSKATTSLHSSSSPSTPSTAQEAARSTPNTPRSNQSRSRPLPTPPSLSTPGAATQSSDIPANIQLARMSGLLNSTSQEDARSSASSSFQPLQPLTIPGGQLHHASSSTNHAVEADQSPAEAAIERNASQDTADHDDVEISPVSSPQARSPDNTVRIRNERRQASLGLTDLDIFASRLADARQNQGNAEGQGSSREGSDGNAGPQRRDTYDDLHLLAEFLGPAKVPGLTAEEMEALPVGRVEVTRRRVVGKRDDGRDKVKLSLAVAGVKVERCPVCLVQFKEGNMACVFPCMHALHERCAQRLLRNTKLCPTCRMPVVGDAEPQ